MKTNKVSDNMITDNKSNKKGVHIINLIKSFIFRASFSKNVKNYIILILVLLIAVGGSSYIFSKYIKVRQIGEDQCFNCHSGLSDKLVAPAKAYTKDIHYSKGVTCADCHGGNSKTEDMEEAMNKSKGFIGVPRTADRYRMCIKCHSDEKVMKKFNSDIPTNQYEKLQNSVHSKSSGDKKIFITDCITCHSVHDIASVKSPASKVYPTKIPALCGGCHSNVNFMKTYNPKLPTDQLSKYYTSLHGEMNKQGNTDVAECVSCHGNHDIKSSKQPYSSVYPLNIPKTCSKCHSDKSKMAKYNIPTNQYSEYVTSVHGIALLKKQDLSAPVCNSCHGNHGAMPPDVESISNVCGTCHTLNAELFSVSPHKTVFDEKKIPECEICHGNHGIQPASDKMLGVQEKSVCIKCHKANDKGYEVAKKMKFYLDSLLNFESSAKSALNEANNKGMDVADAMFTLKDIKQIIMETRTISHLSNLSKFKESIQPGLDISNKAKTTGLEAIKNFYFRREGLGIATIIVSLLVLALYLKIRKLDKKGGKEKNS
ncbi:MAG: cytochrome c3 family protein [Bacteroidota bacterium]